MEYDSARLPWCMDQKRPYPPFLDTWDTLPWCHSFCGGGGDDDVHVDEQSTYVEVVEDMVVEACCMTVVVEASFDAVALLAAVVSLVVEASWGTVALLAIVVVAVDTWSLELEDIPAEDMAHLAGKGSAWDCKQDSFAVVVEGTSLGVVAACRVKDAKGVVLAWDSHFGKVAVSMVVVGLGTCCLCVMLVLTENSCTCIVCFCSQKKKNIFIVPCQTLKIYC